MKVLIILVVTLVAIVGSQRLPLVPLVGTGDEWAVSLGGVKVGTFGRSRDYLGGTEAHASSLAGARVGLSGRDTQDRRIRPIRPFPVVKRVIPAFKKVYDPYYPYVPYRPYVKPYVPPYY